MSTPLDDRFTIGDDYDGPFTCKTCGAMVKDLDAAVVHNDWHDRLASVTQQPYDSTI